MPGDAMTLALAAGGTGGHLFPAEALAHVLRSRGYRLVLLTDARAEPYRATFPADRVAVIAAATKTGNTPWALAATFARLGWGFQQSLRLLIAERVRLVVGFGGYPTLPPVIAGRALYRPAIVHEANAVLGRANRLLSRFATVAVSSMAAADAIGDKTGILPHVTGLPVRPLVREAATIAYVPPTPDGPFRLVVVGGSQGARVFADLVPPAIAALPAALRQRLHLVQQVRVEDMPRVTRAYQNLPNQPDLAPFFSDLPSRIAAAHLVIARAGASTVAELGVIGRPALFVPLPHALDHDQRANAAARAAAGGGWWFAQDDLTPTRLAEEIVGLTAWPQRLADAAAAAKADAPGTAANRLADLVEATIALRRAPQTPVGDRP